MEGSRAGPATRRQLIAGALAAGGALTLSGAAAADTPPPPDDGTLLTAALELERLAVRAYRHTLVRRDLSPRERRVLTLLLRQDEAHAAALGRELVALGRAVPSAPTRDAQVDQALSAHGMSGSLDAENKVKDALQLLLDVEALCEGAYYEAVEGLSGSGAVVLAAQALANEAQHSTLLNFLLHPGDITWSVPGWYVAGVR